MTATLEALQEGRLRHLLVSWTIEDEVLWSEEDGMAVLEGSPIESAYDSGQMRMRPLMDVLVEISAARGTRIEFVREESDVHENLRDEFGGIAGLKRF